VAAALTANAKPYGLALVLGVTPLLIRAFRDLAPRRRGEVAAALAVPLVLGLAAIGWYNWYRTGSVTNFDNAYTGELLATPVNAIGLFLSPGKGLVLYSPLVVLGLLGMRRMWGVDRPLARTVVLAVVLNTVVIAASAQWGDETWGPRYLLPTAWLLLLPLAWWPRDRRHLWWLSGVATLAVVIQFAAVLSRYYVSAGAAQALAGEPVYGPPGGHVAYGDDGPRWIPEASPLLFQLELLTAYVKEKAFGSGFVVSYTPYRGTAGTIDLRHPERKFGPLPDFWWNAPGETTTGKLLAVLLGVVAVGSTAVLIKRTHVWTLLHHGTPLQS
jgi:hypothetical protein